MKSVFKQRKKALDFPQNPFWEAVSGNTKSLVAEVSFKVMDFCLLLGIMLVGIAFGLMLGKVPSVKALFCMILCFASFYVLAEILAFFIIKPLVSRIVRKDADSCQVGCP